ncbi:uncharacterized protein LOC115222714 [Argonauta hians]
MVNQTLFVGLLVLCSVLSICFSECTHNGVTHKNGETWGEKCVKYTCDKHKVRVAHTGCDDGGICRGIGSQWTKHCINYKCEHAHGKFAVKKTGQSCQGHNGRCHKFGQQWKETIHGNCVVRKCIKQNHLPVVMKVSKC